MDPRDAVTFGLAIAGYALLGASTVLHAMDRPGRLIPLLTAAVVSSHVACVWWLRFGFAFDKAVAKGTFGFVLFHGALALVWLGAVLGRPWGALATHGAFAVVSAGAVGAVFKYDVVAVFQIPVLLILSGTVALGALQWRRYVAWYRT